MIHYFDSLDSTSDKAKELIDDGLLPPFAVCSKIQTKGRGRLGSTWNSPEGNLYLTLALPSSGLKPENGQALPIAFGVWLCSFIQENFGLRLTLKWPNDLLFAGQKIAGILCESSISSGQMQTIFVGIGFNLTACPEVVGRGVSPISLDTVLPDQRIEPENFAKRVFTHLLKAYQEESLSQALNRYEEFGIEKGQLWVDPSKKEFESLGLGDDGSLRLGSFGEQLSLTSARHHYKWSYLVIGVPQPELMVMDVGNTTIKVAVFRKARQLKGPDFKKSIPLEGDLKGFFQTIKTGSLHERPLIHSGSVRPKVARSLEKAASEVGVRLHTIPKRPLRVRMDTYRLDQIGIDRLALMESVVTKLQDHNAIAVSFGTATTIDVLSCRGEHFGGYILPGIRTYLDSLSQNGDLLPIIHPESLSDLSVESIESLGHDTESAILNGLMMNLQLLMSFLRKHFHVPETHVFLSGGYGRLVAPLVGGRLVEDAVFEGLRQMTLGGV